MFNQKFKWNPQLYQDNSSYQFNLALIAIKKLKPKENEKILDIGSGNALVTIELSRSVPKGKVVGIELSKDMHEKALINLKKENIRNIELVNIDAIKINYENEFDTVFSNSSIHWFKDLEFMYKLIYRALKKLEE